MGQEVGVTPIQLVSAFSAIANGGMVHPARIVREVRPCGAGTAACGAPAPATDDSAAAPSAAPSTVPPADSSHRAIRQETSATLRRMLEQVVLAGGTGTLA